MMDACSSAPRGVARTRIVPILVRHGVTAMLCGHDHGYERSELPGGLTAVVTGGAGAGTYPKHANAATQNPYSAAFSAKHHYSLIRVEGDTAVLTAVTPEGQVIDRRTWAARRRKQQQR